MFNHSTLNQNVTWTRDIAAQCVIYTALRDINAGEELCISYGRLWFKDADGDDLDLSEKNSTNILDKIDIDIDL